MPAIVGANGVESDVPINLNGEEALKLKESADALKDSEIWDNEYAQRVTYPTGDEAILIHPPARLDSIGTAPLVTSRGIGADTEAILREHGYAEDQIRVWEESGVVVQHA